MIAESAASSGAEVVAVDFFGDRDQARLVESYALQRDLGLPLSAAGLGEASERIPAEAVVYGANLENHPDVVAALGRRHALLGNQPEALGAVRDWRVLRRFCREAGILHPPTLLPGEEELATPGCRRLRKRVRSGGGHGITFWNGESLDDAHVLQAAIHGRAASAAFVADGRRSVLICLTEQLIGRRELGASGFRWCGNILPLDLSPADHLQLTEQVTRMVSLLTRRFGLRGVNGVDLIVTKGTDGAPVGMLVEVNPRYCASMELVEHQYGVNVFSLHLDAFAGRLPEVSPAQMPSQGFLAKGIIFAREPSTAPSTDDWLDGDIRDVPFAGERFKTGHPVCTVLAPGNHRRSCLNALFSRATAIYTELGGGKENSRERTTHPDHRAHTQAGDRHTQRQELAGVPRSHRHG